MFPGWKNDLIFFPCRTQPSRNWESQWGEQFIVLKRLPRRGAQLGSWLSMSRPGETLSHLMSRAISLIPVCSSKLRPWSNPLLYEPASMVSENWALKRQNNLPHLMQLVNDRAKASTQAFLTFEPTYSIHSFNNERCSQHARHCAILKGYSKGKRRGGRTFKFGDIEKNNNKICIMLYMAAIFNHCGARDTLACHKNF